jgi:CBS domain-containing protein
VITIDLSERQSQIVDIVKKDGPIRGQDIAKKLDLTRAALRADLAILTMLGYLEARPRVGYYYSGKTITSLLIESIKKIKVGDVQSIPVVLNQSQTIYDAIVTIFLEDVGTLFIINDLGYLEGVVSRKDLLKGLLGNNNAQSMPISMLMTRMPNIHFITEGENILDAAKKIRDYEIDSLPVVEVIENGSETKLKVVGRLSKTNITRIFVELGEKRGE